MRILKAAVKKILGSRHIREAKKLQPLIDQINELFEEYQSLSEEQLKGKTDEFRAYIADATADGNHELALGEVETRGRGVAIFDVQGRDGGVVGAGLDGHDLGASLAQSGSETGAAQAQHDRAAGWELDIQRHLAAIAAARGRARSNATFQRPCRARG